MSFPQTGGFLDETGLERLEELFAPDTVLLPSQWYGALESGWRSGERRLLHGIFKDAIECWQMAPLEEVATAIADGFHYRGSWSLRKLRLAVEAHRWLFGYETAAVMLDHVCAAWDLDIERFRYDLIQWRASGRKMKHIENPTSGKIAIRPDREKFSNAERAKNEIFDRHGDPRSGRLAVKMTPKPHPWRIKATAGVSAPAIAIPEGVESEELHPLP